MNSRKALHILVSKPPLRLGCNRFYNQVFSTYVQYFNSAELIVCTTLLLYALVWKFKELWWGWVISTFQVLTNWFCEINGLGWNLMKNKTHTHLNGCGSLLPIENYWFPTYFTVLRFLKNKSSREPSEKLNIKREKKLSPPAPSMDTPHLERLKHLHAPL